MKYLGIDYGSKRVGVAVSDAGGTIAFPRIVLENKATLIAELTQIVRAENVERIIIGDTRSHGGEENRITAEAEAFMDELSSRSGMPVSRAFEVFSSVEASRFAPKMKEHDDSAAAAVILQRYLDMGGGKND